VLKEPVNVAEDEITFYSRNITVQVRRSNGKIRRTYQQETIQRARPQGQGSQYQDGWKRDFDEHGRSIGTVKVTSTYSQSAPFSPTDFDPVSGLDLKQDLKIYLLSHGMSQLVPK